MSIAVKAPDIPQDQLFAADGHWSFGVHVDGSSEVLAGDCDSPEELVAQIGKRPAIAHDAKSLGEVPAVLAHDTEVAAYLLEPARRAYPFRELCEERGFAAAVDPEAAADAVLVEALAAWQREQIRGRGLTGPAGRCGAPARPRPARHGEARAEARHHPSQADLRPRQGRGQRPRARDLPAVRHRVHARVAAPARGGPVREARPVTQAPRQDRLLDRRARAPGDPLRARGDSRRSSAGAS